MPSVSRLACNMNSFALSSGWYQAWRRAVRNIRENPSESVGYQRAAVIAQTQYQIWLAIEIVREGKR